MATGSAGLARLIGMGGVTAMSRVLAHGVDANSPRLRLTLYHRHQADQRWLMRLEAPTAILHGSSCSLCVPSQGLCGIAS